MLICVDFFVLICVDFFVWIPRVDFLVWSLAPCDTPNIRLWSILHRSIIYAWILSSLFTTRSKRKKATHAKHELPLAPHSNTRWDLFFWGGIHIQSCDSMSIPVIQHTHEFKTFCLQPRYTHEYKHFGYNAKQTKERHAREARTPAGTALETYRSASGSSAPWRRPRAWLMFTRLRNDSIDEIPTWNWSIALFYLDSSLYFTSFVIIFFIFVFFLIRCHFVIR